MPTITAGDFHFEATAPKRRILDKNADQKIRKMVSDFILKQKGWGDYSSQPS